MVNENLAAWAARSGLEIVPTAPDTEAFFKSPEGLRILASGKMIQASRALAKVERDASAELIDAATRACEGADLVVSTVLTLFRGQAISDAMGIPHVALYTFPAGKTGRHASLMFGGRSLGIGALNRATYELFWRLWWRDTKPGIDEMCRALGLPAYGAMPRIDERRSLHIWSEHLYPRPRDYPAHHEVVGFPVLTPSLRASLGEGEVPPALAAWLDRGPAPVFFGFGSMPVLDPATMLRDVIDLARRRGFRALIGAGWSDLAAATDLPEDVFVAGAFDHDRVLPRCVGAVHHGGAGTTAACARAGLPALIASVSFDQPLWGRTLTGLAVGATIPFPRVRARTLDRAMDTLLDPATQARARARSARLRDEHAAERAADVLERASGESPPRGPVSPGRLYKWPSTSRGATSAFACSKSGSWCRRTRTARRPSSLAEVVGGRRAGARGGLTLATARARVRCGARAVCASGGGEILRTSSARTDEPLRVMVPANGEVIPWLEP
jgi:UDP:flavonoid glycosyltransferase YjiC (YdhE family)